MRGYTRPSSGRRTFFRGTKRDGGEADTPADRVGVGVGGGRFGGGGLWRQGATATPARADSYDDDLRGSGQVIPVPFRLDQERDHLGTRSNRPARVEVGKGDSEGLCFAPAFCQTGAMVASAEVTAATEAGAGPTREDVRAVYERPLMNLVFDAAQAHRAHHDPRRVQCAALLSIKTGGCPENCAYCPQSAHHSTDVEREALLSASEVVAAAKRARAEGADRFCMGAAWRDARGGEAFERVLDMVREVKALGLEACATLGMLTQRQAADLKAAGLDYYNHNLDTSRRFYPLIITTRVYEERLETLRHARSVGLALCCGGIVGMGETDEDRIGLLYELARQQPESVPINALIAVEGTPLEDRPPVPWDVMVRMVAAARILIPRAFVRLSAGRTELSEPVQAMCFLAGANSIFLGDKLLTSKNPPPNEDARLLDKLGLVAWTR